MAAIKQSYVLQMQWQMRCADRSWCDYVSFNPSFPDGMRMLVARVHRDDKVLDELDKELEKRGLCFLSFCDSFCSSNFSISSSLVHLSLSFSRIRLAHTYPSHVLNPIVIDAPLTDARIAAETLNISSMFISLSR